VDNFEKELYVWMSDGQSMKQGFQVSIVVAIFIYIYIYIYVHILIACKIDNQMWMVTVARVCLNIV
jgi:hypothetical protein